MTALTLPAPHTANQRLKNGFGPKLALSLVAATVLHALFFSLWPTMSATSWGATVSPTTQVVHVATTTLPPAPKTLPVPAAPVISAAAPPEATLDLPSWNDVVKLPSPPAPKAAASETADNTWTGPVTVQPSVANPDTLRSALERAYPNLLREAGIGGTVRLLVRIDTHGRVLEAKIERSSGYRALDDAALKVSGILRFHPALNRDTPVSVWVRIPVTFQVHEGGSLRS
jgi:TonB family protein